MSVFPVVDPARQYSWTLIPVVFLILFSSNPRLAFAISLTGSNGRAVEFAEVQSAAPGGISARMVADGPVIVIPWDKLDLEALQKDHKTIYAAYLLAVKGETVDFGAPQEKSDPTPASATAPAPAVPKQVPGRFSGWMDLSVDGIHFMMQLPRSNPRGILVVSIDSSGNSFQYLRRHDPGSGAWGEFQNKYDLALLTYSAKEPARDAMVSDFVFAAKGSGEAMLTAIRQFGFRSGQREIGDLPIALYGAQRSGAAFVYNFVQWQPERVLAAVVSKGAFYDAMPTEKALKVPMLFIWGQYTNIPELWGSENTAQAVLARAAARNPNWTNGRELRGQGEQNAVVDYFAKRYLFETLASRLPAKGEAAESPHENGIIPLERSKGLIGNLETGATRKITDPAEVPTEEETFLPNAEVGNLWKAYIVGELYPPSKLTD